MRRLLLPSVLSLLSACAPGAAPDPELGGDRETPSSKEDAIPNGGAFAKLDPASETMPLEHGPNPGVAAANTDAEGNTRILSTRYTFGAGQVERGTFQIEPRRGTGLKEGASLRFWVIEEQTCPANEFRAAPYLMSTTKNIIDDGSRVTLFQKATFDFATDELDLSTVFLNGSSLFATEKLHQPCINQIGPLPPGATLPPDSEPASRTYFVVPIPRSSQEGEAYTGIYGYTLTASCVDGACNVKAAQ